MKARPKLDIDEHAAKRFRQYVPTDSEGCWAWKGSRLTYGYGQFTLQRPRRTVLAHRMAYWLEYGPFPTQLFVLHKCDNPACVRPDHLFLGTQADNVADAITKGRINHRGEYNQRAKIGPNEVKKIRKLAGTASQHEIAEQFGISQQNVSAILRRETWRDV